MTTWLLEEAEGPSLSAWASTSEANLYLRSSNSDWLRPGVTSPESHRHDAQQQLITYTCSVLYHIQYLGVS